MNPENENSTPAYTLPVVQARRGVASRNLKPRSNSIMARLPEKQREQVNKWLFEEHMAYGQVAKLCKSEFGIKVEPTTLCRYFRARRMKENLAYVAQSATHAHQIVKKLGKDKEEIFQALLQVVSQVVFDAITATEQGSAPNFIPLTELMPMLIEARKDSREEQRFELEREQWEFDVVTACREHIAELQAIVSDRAMPEPARLQAIRRRLFLKNPAPEEL